MSSAGRGKPRGDIVTSKAVPPLRKVLPLTMPMGLPYCPELNRFLDACRLDVMRRRQEAGRTKASKVREDVTLGAVRAA